MFVINKPIGFCIFFLCIFSSTIEIIFDYLIYFKQRVKNPTDRRDTTWLRRRAFILSPLVINAAHYYFETRYFARFIATITNNGRRGMKTEKRELLPSRRSESKNFAEDVGWKRFNLSLSSWFHAIMSNLYLIVALPTLLMYLFRFFQLEISL